MPTSSWAWFKRMPTKTWAWHPTHLESFEERRLVGTGLGRLAEVLVCSCRRNPATRRADDELRPQQIGLDFIAKRVHGEVHSRGQCIHAGGTALEDADQGFQIAAVLLVESFYVDLGHLQGGAGDVHGDA